MVHLMRAFIDDQPAEIVLLAAVPPPCRDARRGRGTGLPRGGGYSNITPELGYPLDGVIAQGQPARHVHDELHARCLALDDGTTRIALAVVDTTMIARDIVERAKRLVQAETGLPANRIMVSATHTHSTPRAVPITGGPHEQAYQEFLGRRMPAASGAR